MARRGVRLTYLAFVAEATVEALGELPILNASVDGEEIVHHDDVNLGIAVALDDGLIVPVIHRAQRLSMEGLAAAIGDLAERARAGRLEPDDVSGGTFTITNPGQFGAVLATPIINQPQVAILDLEAVVKRPVVIGGRRRDRDPPDDEPVHVLGPPRARRGGGRALPRRGEGAPREHGRRAMSAVAQPRDERRPRRRGRRQDDRAGAARARGARRQARPPQRPLHGGRDPLDGARPGARRRADLALPRADRRDRATRCASPAG